MELLTIDEIKANSRIDGDGEDVYLRHVGAPAEKMVPTALRRKFYDLEAEYGAVPPEVRHAVLMLADHLYTHRGATAMQAVAIPYGVQAMVTPYIKLR